MDEKPKILYMDHGMENFQVFLRFHFEDESEIKVFLDSRLLDLDFAVPIVAGPALKMSPMEFIETIIVGGKQTGDQWWTTYGLKWKAGFDALAERDNPEDEERSGGDRPGDVR